MLLLHRFRPYPQLYIVLLFLALSILLLKKPLPRRINSCENELCFIPGLPKVHLYYLIYIMLFIIKKLGLKISQNLFRKTNNFPIKSYLTFSAFLILTQRQKAHLSIKKEQEKFQIPQDVIRKSKQNKIILVLDLDETLVYTRRTSRPQHQNYIEVQFEGGSLYLEYRPYLFEFLQGVSEVFTIYVYTAGRKHYADMILDIIDKQRKIEKRFYRDSCRKHGGSYLKDLRSLKKISRQQKQMILVDDNRESIVFNHPNSMKIKKFEGDQKDSHLVQIFQKLIQLYKQ